MTIKSNVPEIRLKGFSNEWLSEDFDVFFDSSISKNTLSRANLTTEPTQVKNIHYGDILINFGSVVDATNDVDTYIKDAKLDQYKNQFLKEGDVIFADAAEDETVGKSIEIRNTASQNLVSGLHTIPCRPRKKIKPFFLGHYLNSNSYHRQLLPLMQGTKVLSISKSSLLKTRLNIPESHDEQEKIGLSFQSIDRLIALHSKKYVNLLNVKKAMLEKMFPRDGANVPEIRFKGFSNKWSFIELGKTQSYFTDGNYGEAYPKRADMADSLSGVPFLRGSNLSTGSISEFGANYITHEKHSELVSGHLFEDDIVIAVRGSLGALGYVKHEHVGWNINSQLAIIRTDKKELNGLFLIQYLLAEKGQRILLSKNTGTALKQLPIGQLREVLVPVTNLDEQKAIGLYFNHLNELLNLQSIELEKLKNVKKAMLEKMFV